MRLANKFRVRNGGEFRLSRVDPGDTLKLADESAVDELRSHHREALVELQERLYAEHRWSLLLIFQALDAGGKDSTIRDVMSGLGPQGCEVTSFKVPSDDELDHDFMWRYMCKLPRRGTIGIFNRSYYEDVLVPRVHARVFAAQRVPKPLLGRSLWRDRLHDIRAHERYLARNGVVICKFFLHISKAEQCERLLSRMEDPSKHWKFALGDVFERRLFERYLRCYEEAIRATATRHAPWYVIPADHKWFARAVVADAVVHTLRGLQLRYPTIDPEVITRARALLRAPDRRS